MKILTAGMLTLLFLCKTGSAVTHRELWCGLVPDDVDAVAGAAKAAGEISGPAIGARQSQIKVLYDAAKNALTESEKQRAQAIVSLRAEIDSLEDQIHQLERQCEENKQKIKTILSQIKALEREIDSIGKGSKALTLIAQDRTKAAALVALINSNNTARLLDFLKRETGAQDVEVREAKATGGTHVVFRVGAIIHCLSTSLQCIGGKPYSLTK